MRKFTWIYILFLSCTAAQTFAQAGLPDSTFGTYGSTFTIADTPSTKNQAYSVTVQSDDKLIVAGWVGNTTNAKFALARYSSEGLQDLSFGTNGVVKSLVTANGIDNNNAVIALPNGKIVVAGNARDVNNSSDYDIAVLQYNEDGTPDNTFGSGGKTLTSIGTLDYGTCVAAQADGKIVVGGYSWNGTDYDFAIVRYGTNGKLDQSFGKKGYMTTNILFRDYGESVAVQSDGKIVLAGWTANSTNSVIEFAVVRYNSDGSLDNTFGTSGVVTTSPGLYNNIGEALTLQPDGKILVAGKSDMGTGALLYTVVRLNSDGSLDNTFGTGGKTTAKSGSNGGANAIALQADGKIVVSGNALVRYNTDGSIDNTFDTTGITKMAFTVFGLTVQRNGKIVVTGTAINNSHSSFVVARYLSALNYVTTGAVNTLICAGSAIAVPFAETGSFNNGNIFTAQLSDSGGSFASPADLGSQQGKVGGTINVVIPSKTPYGAHYRIRVISSQQSYVYDNGVDIIISPYPKATLSLNNTTLSTQYFASYQWLRNSLVIAKARSQQYTFNQTGSYSVIVSNASGCSDTSDVITISDTILTGTVNGPICAGSILTVPFSAKYFYSNGNTFTAQLSDANGSFSNPVVIGSVQAVASDTIHAVMLSTVPGGSGYRVRVVSSNPVIAGFSNEEDITINPVPLPVIIPFGDTLTTGDFSSYQWLRNDTTIAGATKQQYVALQSGLYSVAVTDANGCTGVSSRIQVGTPAGINSVQDNSRLSLFPNPTSGKINVRLAGSFTSPVELRIFDNYGKMIMEQTEKPNIHSLDFNLKTVPPGVYLLNLQSGEINVSKIIVLTK